MHPIDEILDELTEKVWDKAWNLGFTDGAKSILSSIIETFQNNPAMVKTLDPVTFFQDLLKDIENGGL